MADTTLTFTSAFGQQTAIGALSLDAMVSEETELRAQATEYPVESGGTISDNITIQPERLSISGLVTSAVTTVYGSAGWSKLISAKDVLRQIHEARDTITIDTALDTYEDMVMETCRISRSNEGDHLRIECELVKITTVDLETETVAESTANSSTTGKAGATKTSAGKTNGSTATDKTADAATAKVTAALGDSS